MKCEQCKRKVRNSFTDKLFHVINYHPDRFIQTVGQWPQISRAIGEHLGKQLKGAIYAEKRNITES